MARTRQQPPDGNDPTPEAGESAKPSSRGGKSSSPGAGAASDPFAVGGAPGFEAPKDGRPQTSPPTADLGTPEEQLFEWTPERAGAIVRAAGFALHVADGATRIKPPDHDPDDLCFCDSCRLWKADVADAEEAGQPLSRILNRYDSARRLAGVVDEAEFAAAMLAYAKKNLGRRGRLQRYAKTEAQQPVRPWIDSTPPAFVDETAFAGETVEPQPDLYEDDDPTRFPFDPWAGYGPR